MAMPARTSMPAPRLVAKSLVVNPRMTILWRIRRFESASRRVDDPQRTGRANDNFDAVFQQQHPVDIRRRETSVRTEAVAEVAAQLGVGLLQHRIVLRLVVREHLLPRRLEDFRNIK